jgi:hypothetical protein
MSLALEYVNGTYRLPFIFPWEAMIDEARA